ncbi:MAG: phage holin family protein [Candidatus Latescibacteria bacterium]|nr:phage holin family protein [Candidatus Latescibacterota bacterium]
MSGFLIRFIVSFFALGFTAMIVRGIDIHGNDFQSILALGAAALVLGLLNAIVRPILIVLTLPITIVTLGLFLLVLNALMLWLTSAVVEGFHVSGPIPAFFGAILMAVISFVLNRFVKDPKERRRA